MTIERASRLGREETHPVDTLRTRVWFQAVLAKSGAGNTNALAKRFEELRNFDESAPPARTWRRYKDGERVPRRAKDEPYLVDLAESHFSGTSWYFDNLFWDVLKGDQVCVERIDQALVDLNPQIREIVFETSPTRVGGLVPRDLDFMLASCLVAQESFEAFIASVLLVVKSAAIAQHLPREEARRAYIELQDHLDHHPVVGQFSAEICKHADAVCKLWFFRSNQALSEVHQITHRQNICEAMERLGAVRVEPSAEM